MYTFIRILSLILLLFNGFGALYGSYHFITDPSGESLQMPRSFLQHSPFSNYLIPGIVLFVVNGLFSFMVTAALLLKHRLAPTLVMLQGILLAGWIVVQVMLLQTFYPPLHLTMFGIGGMLIGCGGYLAKLK
jgi:hypothetical protein